MTAHVPRRTCVGCREVADQFQLLRWVLDDSDPQRVLADPTRSRSGRGAWLHPDPECARLAVRRRGFSRAFRSGGIVHDLDALLAALSDRPPGGHHTRTTPEGGSETVETR